MQRASPAQQRAWSLYTQGHSVAQVEHHLRTHGLPPAQAQQVARGTFRRYHAQRRQALRRAQQRAAGYLTLGSVFAVASGLLLALDYVFHGAWPGPAWAYGAGLGLSLGAVGYGVRERRRAAETRWPRPGDITCKGSGDCSSTSHRIPDHPPYPAAGADNTL